MTTIHSLLNNSDGDSNIGSSSGASTSWLITILVDTDGWYGRYWWAKFKWSCLLCVGVRKPSHHVVEDMLVHRGSRYHGGHVLQRIQKRCAHHTIRHRPKLNNLLFFSSCIHTWFYVMLYIYMYVCTVYMACDTMYLPLASMCSQRVLHPTWTTRSSSKSEIWTFAQTRKKGSFKHLGLGVYKWTAI